MSPCSEGVGEALAWLAVFIGGAGLPFAPELSDALAGTVLAAEESDEGSIASGTGEGASSGTGFAALLTGIVPDVAGMELVTEDCVASTVDPAVESECSIGAETCLSLDGVCGDDDTAGGVMLVEPIIGSACAFESGIGFVSGYDTFAG